MAFVHRQKLQNPDIQKEFKNGWLARFLFRKGGFVRVTLIVRFVTLVVGSLTVSDGFVTLLYGFVTEIVRVQIFSLRS